MWSKAENLVTAIFGGILTIAIIAVVVSRKSQTPQVFQAAGSFIGNLVAAAVNPIQTAGQNGNLGATPFSTPNIPAPGLSASPQ